MFWIVVGVSAGLAAAWVGAPRLFAIATKLRSYPLLLERVASLESELSERHDELARLEGRSRDLFRDGITEGKSQIVGALLAAKASAPPQLSIVTSEDAGLQLVAESADPASVLLGARFDLEVMGAEKRLGAVQVILIDHERSLIHLSCVEKTEPAFWAELEQRASHEFAPPAGVILKVPGIVGVSNGVPTDNEQQEEPNL